jgi:membrane protein
VFGLGWLGASVLFVLYVKLAGAYASNYGVIGGVVVILLWLQLTMYALLAGAEINAQLEDPATVKRAGGEPVQEEGAAAASRPSHTSPKRPSRSRGESGSIRRLKAPGTTR